MTEHVPPSAPEAEKNLCARILCHPPEIAEARQVWTDDLTDPHHRAFFRTCRDLSLEGEPLDPLLIAERLSGKAPFRDRVAIAEYMSDLEEASINADAKVAVKLVLEASRKRRIYQSCDHALKAAANGQASSTILSDLQSDLFDLQRACEVSSRFKAITAAELDSGKYDQKYLVEHVLAEWQPCILAGPKKALKTTFLVDLGISIAIADKFLGKFWIPSAKRFLLTSGESGMATLQETARRIAKSKGWELAAVPNFVISPDLPRLDDPENLAEWEQFLETHSPEVVAIDPAYLCMPGDDAGNLFKQGVLLRNISELCQRQSITLILAHHAKRHIGRDPHAAPELDDIAWAGFSEFARQWLLIGRRESYEAGSGDHRLWLSVGGSAGHGGLYAVDVAEGTKQDIGGRRYEVAVQSASEARKDAAEREHEAKAEKRAVQVEADRKAICNAMATLEDNQGTKSDIRTASGLGTPRFNPALASLIQDKSVTPTMITKGNNREYEGYKLADETGQAAEVRSGDSVDSDQLVA